MLLGLLGRLRPHHLVLGRLLLPLLFAGVIVACVIMFLNRRFPTGTRRPEQPWPPRDRPPKGEDPALYELRLRYARGEIGPEEYNRRAADLTRAPDAAGGPPGTGAGPSGQ